MRKMKKFLLTLMCLSILGAMLYRVTYSMKTSERSLQAIKINEEIKNTSNIDKEQALAKENQEIKEKEENIVKPQEKPAPKVKTEVKFEASKEVKTEVKVQDKEEPQIKTEEYKKVSKKPSETTIVIDPGHASVTSLVKEQQAPGSTIMKVKEPGGAQGINTKTPEYLVNMEVAIRLRSLLQEKGYTVIMTKTENKQMLGNIARAEIGNKANADLVIRIHADSSDSSSVNGASMLVPANNKYTGNIYNVSKKYGTAVLNKLIDDIGMKNRGVSERDDMTGFNWSKVPVILVEMGFQSNVSEDKLLSSSDYQDKLAKSLSEGIHKALME
ncbi:N-acetylmuramoyl-L-alanine amidase [Clostridium sp. CS001]|uniref:N-acetylmuramoyl-L-alanine amidase n=1 Tax=Clostridium sp. CS001 TaxID=2880648 RepID=UPI001CF1C821|nr:N-acetylmuramoyl-L-alanine amidase [Clostridium sp. CS001]MCB2289968.1 N-acetylmuramoyl-L-alanine amidase [Clostridium sp. CS001]